MKKSYLKSEYISKWVAVPTADPRRKSNIWYAVAMSDDRRGLLEIDTSKAFGRKPDWCRLTLVGPDGAPSDCLDAARIVMPAGLRHEIVQIGLHGCVYGALKILECDRTHPEFGDFILHLRHVMHGADHNIVFGLARTIKALPSYKPEDSDNTVSLTYLRRMARELRKIEKSNPGVTGDQP